jgi:hypothetical protein
MEMSDEFDWSCCRTKRESPLATTPGVSVAVMNRLRPALASSRVRVHDDRL